LLFLMISATFTGSIITHFETALAANLVLSSFIPMLMSTGGNTGSQASTTIIRSLSLGEIRYRDIPRILLKECGTAILCGVTLAVVNFAKLMLIDRVGVMVSIVVCLTILAVALVANLVGSLMPLLAKRLGLDPTVMASPLISTILDAVSLILFFNIAVAVLNM
ncbi:MAG: magnesium transporter, partial [Acutalibacter sp.]